MTAYCIDTNALLRFLLLDNPTQAQTVREVIVATHEGSAKLFVSQLILSETAFVLTKVYKYPVSDVAARLIEFVSDPYLDIENRSSVQRALSLYANDSLSIVDLFLLFNALSLGQKLLTFDKKLIRLEQVVGKMN